MSSIRESILAQSFARLTATPTWPVNLARQPRRMHRTPVKRENAPTIHQVDGPDDKLTGVAGSKNVCGQPREVAWTISIFTRGDESGHTDADLLLLEVMNRLNPRLATWGAGIVVEYGTIDYDNEIADDDATRLDIAFKATYSSPEWHLDGVAP